MTTSPAGGADQDHARDTAGADVACPSCGQLLAGEYCASCGERRADLLDLSLRGFLRDAVRDVFDFDARGYRTFRALIARPGLLTADFVAGRRRPWLSPLQVFLIANLVFFIALSFVQLGALTPTLGSHLNQQSYSDFARDLVRGHFAGQDSVDYTGYAERFDFATAQYAKSLVILLVPGMAAVFALLFVRRRDPAGTHLGFALHFVAFLLLLLPLVTLLVRQLPPDVANLAGGEAAFAMGIALGLLPWTYRAFRRVYRAGAVYAATAAALTFLSLVVVLHAYRFILFLVVFHTI